MLERGTTLNEVVAQQSEGTMLGKDGSFVVERAILEVEHESAGHPVTAGDLDEVTVGNSLAGHRAQHQKSVNQALGIPNGDWPIRRCASRRCLNRKLGSPGYEDEDKGRGQENGLFH